jgi:hypothetical protein
MRILSSVLLLLLATAVGCEDYKPAPVAPVAPPTPAPAPQVAPVQQPRVVFEKADVGVGQKGRDYGPGFVTTPVSQYFRAKEAIVFRVEVPHALQLHKALTGHAPQTLEEFVSLMKENQIKLPELPEGHKYVYDPKKEELMVMHP